MKVLVIRFSSIGDIVLTTPVVRCLKRQKPGTEIHYLTKKQFAGILSSNPYIDKVISLEDSLADTIALVKQERYDVVIDLHHNLRTLRVKARLGRPSYSFDKLNLKKWLLVNLKVNRMPDIHIVDRYLDTLKPLGVVNDEQGLDYFIPATETIDKSTWPAGFVDGYITFAIGGQHNTKKLPNHKVADIITHLDYPVILLGGKEDIANGQQIAASVTTGKVFSLCGQLSLNQSALAVKQSKGLITHDTGLMHIGAALDVPIVSVWGNTVPQFGMYPYYKTNSGAATKAMMAEVLGLRCRPCSKIGYEKCPLKHFKCMEMQDTAAIAKAARVFI